ncbi:MAG: DUF6476 family protein [Gemmobacter sp.]|jgi:hypothetical protein|nr:DUF6476 family protein [Gemmobacter sp.]
MQDTSGPDGLPPGLRWLKGLVMVLTVTLILGVITIVGLLVTRMPRPAPPPDFPANLALPEGARPEAITRGAGWIGIVSTDGRLFIFNEGGALRQEIAILPR